MYTRFSVLVAKYSVKGTRGRMEEEIFLVSSFRGGGLAITGQQRTGRVELQPLLRDTAEFALKIKRA